jgi:hypothetical protein
LRFPRRHSALELLVFEHCELKRIPNITRPRIQPVSQQTFAFPDTDVLPAISVADMGIDRESPASSPSVDMYLADVTFQNLVVADVLEPVVHKLLNKSRSKIELPGIFHGCLYR